MALMACLSAFAICVGDDCGDCLEFSSREAGALAFYLLGREVSGTCLATTDTAVAETKG